MLEKGNINKDELIVNINKIQFRSVFSDPTADFSDKYKGFLRRTRTRDKSLNNALTTNTSFKDSINKLSYLLSSDTLTPLLPNKNFPISPVNQAQGVSNHRQAPSMPMEINKISSLDSARRAHHSTSRSSENLRTISLMEYLQSKESQMKVLESLRKTLDSYGSRRDSSNRDRLVRKPDERTWKRIIGLANLNVNFSLTERCLKPSNKLSIEETQECGKSICTNKITVKKPAFITLKGKVGKAANAKFSKFNKNSRNEKKIVNKKESGKFMSTLNAKLLYKKYCSNCYEPAKPNLKPNKESPKKHRKVFSSNRLLEHINSQGKVTSSKKQFQINKDSGSLLKAVQNINQLQFNIKDKTGVKTQEIIRNLKEQMNACMKMVGVSSVKRRSNPLIVGSQ
jgi:hypothetical protein